MSILKLPSIENSFLSILGGVNLTYITSDQMSLDKESSINIYVFWPNPDDEGISTLITSASYYGVQQYCNQLVISHIWPDVKQN